MALLSASHSSPWSHAIAGILTGLKKSGWASSSQEAEVTFVVRFFTHTLSRISETYVEALALSAHSSEQDALRSPKDFFVESLDGFECPEDACSCLRIGLTVRKIGIWECLESLHSKRCARENLVFDSLKVAFDITYHAYSTCRIIHVFLDDLSNVPTGLANTLASPFLPPGADESPVNELLCREFGDGVGMEAALVGAFKSYWGKQSVGNDLGLAREWTFLSSLLSAAFVEYNQWGWMSTDSGEGKSLTRILHEQTSTLKDRLMACGGKIPTHVAAKGKVSHNFIMASFWRTSVSPDVMLEAAALLDSAVGTLSSPESQRVTSEGSPAKDKLKASVRLVMGSVLLASLERLFFFGVCCARGFMAACNETHNKVSFPDNSLKACVRCCKTSFYTIFS